MAKKICSVDGCSEPSRCWGYCSKHFQRARKYGDPTIRLKQAKGETNFLCTFPGCNRKHKSKGFCDMHYQRFNRFGDPGFTKIRPHGAGTIVPDGYLKITLPDGSRILKHRHVMEQYIGRRLEIGEIVHHIDGNPLNNSVENLEILTQSDHMKSKHKDVYRTNLAKGRKHRWPKNR